MAQRQLQQQECDEVVPQDDARPASSKRLGLFQGERSGQQRARQAEGASWREVNRRRAAEAGRGSCLQAALHPNRPQPSAPGQRPTHFEGTALGSSSTQKKSTAMYRMKALVTCATKGAGAPRGGCCRRGGDIKVPLPGATSCFIQRKMPLFETHQHGVAPAKQACQHQGADHGQRQEVGAVCRSGGGGG